ncbi:Signal recognition particle, SRP54 subunit, GTPase [Mycena venus]|uniref:Signal recognition particle, SRP54 subunit, GTPase n=1 Tax=Mycena venus TaxID=2733690 RepID=A0A8H7D703_9AGAR|nr:Signal recognition particle, SRP54 subunit, GTPase [Mycena venus]
MDDTVSFPSLPTEILCTIIRLVDPIGLISLSQSSRAFRALIQPSQDDFVQRLLALELDPAVGGIVRFRSRDNDLMPPWNDAEAWKAIRFACVGCMKLLPHTRFSNQNLLQLRRRKPPPGSREANRITDWEPSAGGDAKARGLRLQERARREKEDRAAVRFELEWSSDAEVATVDERDAWAETILSGAHRTRRRCNECRFRRGDFARPTRANVGTAAVPVLKSRRVEFTSVLNRYFPGLLPRMPLEMVPLLFKIYKDNVRTEHFTLYHARCPGCAVWQELGAFRVGLPYEHATPSLMLEERRQQLQGEDVFATLLCNRCLCARHGRARLGEELAAFAAKLLDAEYDWKEYQLRFGWKNLEETFRLRRRKKDRSSRMFQEIIAGLPWVEAKDIGDGRKMLDFDRCDPDDLRQRIVRLRVLVETEMTEEKRKEFLKNKWFRLWLEEYEKNETWAAMLKELRSTSARPDALVDFVLEKDPYRVI